MESLSTKEYKEEAKKCFEALGISSYTEFLTLAGYSKGNRGKTFYQTGVSSKALAFLNLCRRYKYLKEANTKLLQIIENLSRNIKEPKAKAHHLDQSGHL